MVWRGLVKTFPLFFAYTVLVPSRDVILLLLLPNSGNTYSMVFWWGDAAAILLSLGVVVEILCICFARIHSAICFPGDLDCGDYCDCFRSGDV